MERITEMKLNELVERVRRTHDVNLMYHPDVIRYLVYDNLTTDSDSGGARSVAAKLDEEVTSAVAAYINRYPDVRDVAVVVEGSMAIDNKMQLESQANIRVGRAVKKEVARQQA